MFWQKSCRLEWYLIIWHYLNLYVYSISFIARHFLLWKLTGAKFNFETMFQRERNLWLIFLFKRHYKQYIILKVQGFPVYLTWVSEFLDWVGSWRNLPTHCLTTAAAGYPCNILCHTWIPWLNPDVISPHTAWRLLPQGTPVIYYVSHEFPDWIPT